MIFFVPIANSEALTKNVPSSVLVKLPNRGHFVMMEKFPHFVEFVGSTSSPNWKRNMHKNLMRLGVDFEADAWLDREFKVCHSSGQRATRGAARIYTLEHSLEYSHPVIELSAKPSYCRLPSHYQWSLEHIM